MIDAGTELVTAHANIIFNPGTGDALAHIATSPNSSIYTVAMFPLTGAVVSFNAQYFYDPDEAISRIILFASPAELLAAFQAGSIIIARGTFTSWGETEACVFYFSYASADFSQVQFYGYDPNIGGIDVVGFYTDASGETMSTDGGYVPTT